MGPTCLPHAVLSWSGLLNGQTELNGGGRRPTLARQPGQVLDRTRILVPIETVGRAAYVSSDYIEFASKHSNGDHNDFIRSCINAGVPWRTNSVIGTCVTAVSESWKHRDSLRPNKWAPLSWVHRLIRSALFDTGANGSIDFRDVEAYLWNARKSILDITVASKPQATGWAGWIVANHCGEYCRA